MNRRILFGCLGLALAVLPALIAQEHKGAPHWSYEGAEGPAHWGDLDPAFSACKTGREQAPIDIVKVERGDSPAIHFDYKASPLAIVDNGHSVQINYAPGSSIEVGGHRYELKQFHFHHPAENKVYGRLYEMEIHFVHADKDGKQGVVGVFVDEGKANASLDTLWKNLPKVKNQESKPSGATINAADLLPAEHGYYSFPGSLTSPPCSEPLSWFLMKNPDSATSAQIQTFARLYPLNARPTQPLHERVVRESK